MFSRVDTVPFVDLRFLKSKVTLQHCSVITERQAFLPHRGCDSKLWQWRVLGVLSRRESPGWEALLCTFLSLLHIS